MSCLETKELEWFFSTLKPRKKILPCLEKEKVMRKEKRTEKIKQK